MFCGSIAFAADKIGIAFPTQNQERWYKEGYHLSNLLKKEGDDVDLFFGGDNDANLQVRQVGRLINSGCNVLIIPVITGQDGELEAVKNIHKGLLGMTIFKDANILCDRVVRMTNQLVNKQDVEINDNETYNNGKILEKTFMCEVTVVDKSNYKKVFVDSGLIDEKNLD